MPARFRTYINDDPADGFSDSVCSVWQAACATCAAATAGHIHIGGHWYADEATGLNNPVEAVLEEAESIWPDAKWSIQCIVSIGPGVPELEGSRDNLEEVVETLKLISETEETERRFYRNQKLLGLDNRYFRYNIQRGLGEIGLEEHNKFDVIEAGTQCYLQLPETKAKIAAFIIAHIPHFCT
jgi:hypothetical protein